MRHRLKGFRRWSFRDVGDSVLYHSLLGLGTMQQASGSVLRPSEASAFVNTCRHPGTDPLASFTNHKPTHPECTRNLASVVSRRGSWRLHARSSNLCDFPSPSHSPGDCKEHDGNRYKHQDLWPEMRDRLVPPEDFGKAVNCPSVDGQQARLLH